MSDKSAGFRRVPAVTNEHLHDRLCSVECDVKRHGELIAEVKGSVDTLLDFALEDRKSRSTEIVEQGKTDRERVSARARIIVGLFTAIGVVAGAAATVLASGCF